MRVAPKKRGRAHREQAGQTMVILVASLAVAGVLGAILLGTVFSSNGSTQPGIDNEPGVAEASGIQAQQALSTALTTVETAASAGGYESLSASSLSTSDPSISFVDGPSSNASTISVSVSQGSSQSGAGNDDTGVGGGSVAAAASAAAAADGSVGASGGTGGTSDTPGSDSQTTGGTVTLANRSSAGTCWLIWKSEGSATWFGAQTDQSSCTAPALPSSPISGSVSSTSIGWQENGFPNA
jgi:hypothetical protein